MIRIVFGLLIVMGTVGLPITAPISQLIIQGGIGLALLWWGAMSNLNG